mmetsp:Transcript_56480/g.104581  ORF Transcript_56480/g.104581 Transcript_56480/m.104581 type:complete len:333 (+) Transcript_56480:120-1118(+)
MDSESLSDFRSSGGGSHGRASMIEMERIHADDTQRTRLLKEVMKSQDRVGSFSGNSRRASRLGNLGMDLTGGDSSELSGGFFNPRAGSKQVSEDNPNLHPDLKKELRRRSSGADISAKIAELLAKGGLDALPATAGMDPYCLRASRADQDLVVQMSKTADRMRELCGRLEAMEHKMATPEPKSADGNRASREPDVRIVARPKGSNAKAERARKEATALKYVSNTCEWKELDDMESSVMQSDEEELPRTLQPKRGGSASPRIHPYLYLLTDSALLDDEMFRQCIWGESPCQVAMGHMRAAQQVCADKPLHNKKSRTCAQAASGGLIRHSSHHR